MRALFVPPVGVVGLESFPGPFPVVDLSAAAGGRVRSVGSFSPSPHRSSVSRVLVSGFPWSLPAGCDVIVEFDGGPAVCMSRVAAAAWSTGVYLVPVSGGSCIACEEDHAVVLWCAPVVCEKDDVPFVSGGGPLSAGLSRDVVEDAVACASCVYPAFAAALSAYEDCAADSVPWCAFPSASAAACPGCGCTNPASARKCRWCRQDLGIAVSSSPFSDLPVSVVELPVLWNAPSACVLCAAPMPDFEDAVEAGWVPSVWSAQVGGEELGVCCPSCADSYCVADEDGEIAVSPSLPLLESLSANTALLPCVRDALSAAAACLRRSAISASPARCVLCRSVGAVAVRTAVGGVVSVCPRCTEALGPVLPASRVSEAALVAAGIAAVSAVAASPVLSASVSAVCAASGVVW